MNKQKIEILYTFNVKESKELLTFLLEKLPNLSRNKIKGFLTRKQILVDGGVISQHNFKLSKGDVVQISKFGLKEIVKRTNNQKLDIIYEDEDFIAINKPCGLLSVASDNEKQNNAYSLLMNYVRENNPQARIYLLHRIDKETSGVLVFSKNEKLHSILQLHWNDYVKTREYVAICEGVFKNKKGEIKTNLLKNENNLMYSTNKKNIGQTAITNYEVLKENDKFSLVKVLIYTGRKNQIRVHMKELGHGVVGDEKYNIKANPIGRLGLHAKTLSFIHPFKKTLMTFSTLVPKEFKKLFK